MLSNSIVRKSIGLGIALLAFLVVGCNAPMSTGPDAGSTAIQMVSATPSASKLGDKIAAEIKNLKDDMKEWIEADFDQHGGSLTAWGCRFDIPSGSLRKRTHIRMEIMKGHPEAVQMLPEGLKFEPGSEPTLTLSTDNVPAGANPFIVYIDDKGNVKEVLTTYSRDAHTISAKLHHFSGYAVDW